MAKTRKLSILMIGGFVPWHPRAGGGQIFAYKLSEALARLGHDIDYIAIAPKSLQREIEWGKIICFEKSGLLSQLSQSLKEEIESHDIIHIHQGDETVGYGLGYGICRKIFRGRHRSKRGKICLSIHAPKVHNIPRAPSEVVWRFSWTNADMIFSVSEFSKENISEAYCVPKSKIRVTYAGVDEEFLDAKRELHEVAVPALLFVGRLGGFREQKGVDILIKAMPFILAKRKVKLALVGSGNPTPYLALANELGIIKNIEFFGFLSRNKLLERFLTSDIFVFPSRRESFGLVLVEAMAAGLPVVSTNATAIPEVVKGGETGILVPPDAPEKFAEAVNSLLDDPIRMNRMGLRGRERVREHFTWEKIAERVLNYYREIL